MKLFVAAVLVSLSVFIHGCSGDQSKNNAADSTKAVSSFGEKITPDGAVPVAELIAKMNGQDSMEIKLEGTVDKVCQKKGCWMDIKLSEDQKMKVRFKDYGFFVPKDCGGKTAIMQGKAYLDTLSVKELRHYAEDGGKTEAEIAAITEPKVEYTFMASGVLIK